MIPRPRYLDQLGIAAGRSPITALLGPRQCGKTTLARIFGQGKNATYGLSIQAGIGILLMTK
jgi:uncharacterized protein